MALFARTHPVKHQNPESVIPRSFIAHPFDQPDKYMQLARAKFAGTQSPVGQSPVVSDSRRPRPIPEELEVMKEDAESETEFCLDKKPWSFVSPCDNPTAPIIATKTTGRRSASNPRARLLLRHSSSMFTGFQRKGKILTDDQVSSIYGIFFACAWSDSVYAVDFECEI